MPLSWSPLNQIFSVKSANAVVEDYFVFQFSVSSYLPLMIIFHRIPQCSRRKCLEYKLYARQHWWTANGIPDVDILPCSNSIARSVFNSILYFITNFSLNAIRKRSMKMSRWTRKTNTGFRPFRFARLSKMLSRVLSIFIYFHVEWQLR